MNQCIKNAFPVLCLLWCKFWPFRSENSIASIQHQKRFWLAASTLTGRGLGGFCYPDSRSKTACRGFEPFWPCQCSASVQWRLPIILFRSSLVLCYRTLIRPMILLTFNHIRSSYEGGAWSWLKILTKWALCSGNTKWITFPGFRIF